MTIQQMADIAAKADTPVADEMLRACAVWSYENGIPVSIPRDRLVNAIYRRTEHEVRDEDLNGSAS